MGATIGIDECDDVTRRMPNSAITRGAGAGLQFAQQSCAGMLSYNMLGGRNRTVVHNDDLEEATRQALSFKAAEAGVKGIWLIEMRDYN